MSAEVVFLHGLESHIDADGVPIGRKALFLRDRFEAATPALDTSAARRVAQAEVQATGTWRYPFDGYEDAFRVPLERARAAIGPDTRVVVASSFGGAVALRLLHEAPTYRGAVIFLAGAGPKLTPYRTLPAGVRCLLVHGRQDDVVPAEDSVALAATSETAELRLVDDEHRLASVVDDDHLGAWVEAMLAGPA